MNKHIAPKIMVRLTHRKTTLAFGVLAVCFLVAFYVIAWQEPTQAPPSGNVPTPINVGTDPQAKAGRLSATEFYDYNDSTYYLDPDGQSFLKDASFNVYKMAASHNGEQYRYVEYTCPLGTAPVLSYCTPPRVYSYGYDSTASQVQPCVWTVNGRKAVLTAYVVYQRIGGSPITASAPVLAEACPPRTDSEYDCGGISCEVRFFCGQEQGVGTYGP